MYENDNDRNVQDAQRQIQQITGTVTRPAVGLAKRAAQEGIKQGMKLVVKAIKAIVQAVAKLVELAIAYWPVTLVIIAVILIILLIVLAWNWQINERGSSGMVSLEASENITEVSEDGVRTVVAMKEEQALADAYYKYMACDSHEKIFVYSDGSGVHEKTLRFSNPEETSDFASLVDLYDKEGYFYLSPYFIQMADELLHDGEFYYPEQVIKPVFSKALPLESDSSKRYITALPLVDDGSEYAQALKDGNPNTNGYAISESLIAADGEELRRPKLVDTSKALLAISKTHVKEEILLHDEDGQPLYHADGTQRKTMGLSTAQGSGEEYGVWDYGFGSVLQYEAKEKEKWINIESVSVPFHVHKIYWDSDEGTWVNTCSETVDIELDFSKSVDDEIERINELIESYNYVSTGASGTTTYEVVRSPSESDLRLMFKDHDHVVMCIQDEDMNLAKRIFSDSVLQANFGNGDAVTNQRKKRYPLNTSVISAAATFSGNIRYEYAEETSTSELREQNGTQGNFTDDWADDCTSPVYGTYSDCFVGEVTRSGTVHDRHPSANPTEISVPTGFQYVEDYSSNYEIYVPNFVKQDKNFTERVAQEQDGAYDESLDANGDGKLTLMDFLLRLGLLRPYSSGGFLSSAGGGFSTGELSAENLALMQQMGCPADEEGEIRLLAKAIAAEAGPNKLDQLMVGCVIVNRVKSTLFPNTMIEVLRAPGQYASWTNGSIQAREPTEEQLSSARQILYGEFAIPSSIVFQAGFVQGQATYMIVDNGGFPFLDNYYCSYGDIAAIDIFGRAALTSDQARELAEALHQQDIANGVSSTPAGGETPAAGQVITSSIQSDEPLYSVTGFDVQTAIRNMQKTADRDSVGFLDSFLAHAGAAFSGIADQITSFFDAIGGAFGSKNMGDFVVMYNHNVPLVDMRDMVIQAVTFTDQVTYSSAKEIFDPDVLQFIFLGKDGWTGFGQGTNSASGATMIPGVGSVFTDFTSPTSMHYNVSRSFDEVTGSATIAVPEGVMIQSVGAMTVVSSTQAADGTYQVELRGTADGKSLSVIYGNLSESSVSAGQSVAKGDKVGTAANGGLELTVIVDGVKVDPMRYFYQPTFGSGAAFMNVLSSNGTVDESLRSQLQQMLCAANKSPSGPYDKWHDPANRSTYHVKSVGECTWWAYGRAWQYCEENGTLPAGGLLQSYGNGGDYYGNGVRSFAVGQTARAGSWIVWRRLTPDSRGQYYGHVAFVEAVASDGTVVYSESYRALWDRGNGSGISVRTVRNTGSPSNPNYPYSSNYSFVGFVYLDSPR